jgi:hypothetical protein
MVADCDTCQTTLEGECFVTKQNGVKVGTFCCEECRDEYHHEHNISFRNSEKDTFYV